LREQADPVEVSGSILRVGKRVTAVGKFYGQATKGVRGDA